MEEDKLLKHERKLLLREKRYIVEQLFKVKRSEEYEALEEVFDKPTLMTLYGMLRRDVISEIYGAIKAGKESKLFWAKGPRGEDLAVKIYLTVTAEFRTGMLMYIEGDPRFSRVRRDRRGLVYQWASKEFKNLKEAYGAGVRVPKPVTVRNNVLVMGFIGRDGVPAPLLREVELRNPARVYKMVVNDVRKLYRKAGLVHGDLSEYNIMYWRGLPYLIDLSQAVPLEHPMSDVLLKRDIVNLNRFFRRLGVEVMDEDQLYRWIISGV
ncbi:serine protein kinase RIO [Candidatus Bathyarchaeota archaeon]|nr:serine protein kinase RIO [Candidatus Bathyarchaeota archaeon]